MQASNSLSSLKHWREFQSSDEGRRLFPTTESLRWFIRQNRVELMRAGALVQVRRSWHLVMPEFDAAVIFVLQKNAKEKSLGRVAND